MNEKVIEYFSGDVMAASVWQSKYQLKDKQDKLQEETPTDMHKRLAREFGRIEYNYHEDKERLLDVEAFRGLSDFGQKLLSKRGIQSKQGMIDEIFSYFDKFKWIVPQGSIMANLGNKYIVGSLSNCFGIASPYDSYAGIMRTDEEIAQLEKRRGGVGAPLDTLRPADSPVNNAARTSTGVVAFAERYSNTTREVAQGGRRGALMLLLSCQHPEIFKFVTMKDDKTKVTGANVSVTFTEEFMQAVESDSDFHCRFPVDHDLNRFYDYKNKTKDGIIDGYNVVVPCRVSMDGEVTYVMKIRAKELFDLVVEMAWKNGEPGVAFIDRIQDYAPDGVYEQYKATVCNPCSEQWFAPYETCRLIAMNLFSIVSDPFTDKAVVDWEKLYEVAYMQQRLGDDLVDLEIEYIDAILAKIESDPEPEEIKRVEKELWIKIRKVAVDGRRTGSGFTGLGDMLAALGLKYGSTESIDIVKAVTKVKIEAELDCTIDMAILRGTFEGWNRRKEFYGLVDEKGSIKEGKNSFFQMLCDEFSTQVGRMERFGRRNVNWSTVSPTGTVSLMTQTTSGLEPLFKAYYTRRKKINHNDKDARIDFIDQNGDEWQEYTILHPKFKEWLERISTGEEQARFRKDNVEHYFKLSPWYGSEANDIDYRTRIEIQAAIQKYTSNAISATVNLPENVSKEVVGNIYMMAWKKGLKGVTVYREGSRSGVLVNNEKKMSATNGYNNSPKRPKELDADYYFATSKGKDYAVIVGKLDNHPYEIFAFENPVEHGNIHGTVVKTGKGAYSFKSAHYDIANLQLSSDHTDERLLTRWTSQMLRHGVDPKYIAEQVEKSEVKITSFSKVITRILKKYILDQQIIERCPECNEATVVYSEGCKKCSSCGYSKC